MEEMAFTRRRTPSLDRSKVDMRLKSIGPDICQILQLLFWRGLILRSTQTQRRSSPVSPSATSSWSALSTAASSASTRSLASSVSGLYFQLLFSSGGGPAF